MTRRTSAPKGTTQSSRIPWRAIGAWLARRQVIGALVATIGALTVVSLLSVDEGIVSALWTRLLSQIFGVGVYPVALAVFAGGLLLLFRDVLSLTLDVPWQRIVGGEAVFVLLLGLIHVFTPGDPLQLAQAGHAGGLIGLGLWGITVPWLGRALSAFLLMILIVVAGCVAAGISWRMALWRVQWAWASLGTRVRRMITERRLRRMAASAEDVPPDLDEEPGQPAVVAAQTRPRARSGGGRKGDVLLDQPRVLPPMVALAADVAVGSDDAGTRHQAQVIEETLSAFGIPAQVVEWNRGPAVTQFGVEPGYVERNERQYKVRVSKILSLQNDLALALAAAPIRVEAPVPGRAVVGIEVPNADKAVVGLRGILESEQYARLRSALKISLGRDVSGAPVVADLARMPHLLLAGATGSGKSVCLNAIIVSLLYQHTEESLKLLLVDPKRVELTKYNGLPHLIAPVVVDAKKTVAALRWLTGEMESRYKQFAQVGARNLTDYNRGAQKRREKPVPMIVMVIDELADLMLAAPDEVERTICRLAQMARATGIHLVVATQRPSVDVVTGLIKANFPARISFAVTSQIDSRVILDAPGAEKLLGHGDMLFMAPDSPKLQRIQGSFVSDREIDNLMAWYEAQRQAVPEPLEPEPEQTPPWEGLEPEPDDGDDLLAQAAELVRDRENASASFLQRQMRIGYPRAARLMDELEERGIVGPKREGGRSRAVIADTAASDGEAQEQA
ncbi:MAG: DNA translocase FtsK [Anaerolineae bacterium]|jgi:S-DNA-T family DNA segregation ATPase FtsK/SpoIIIE|nr:DNA translocase FtsK [Chloroflexota bacterium]